MPGSRDFGFGSFSDAIAQSAAAREEQRKEFNRNLGEPARFVPQEDDSRFGIGYWRAENGTGVFSYRRYANGYDPYSRVEYPADLIDMLVNVRDGD
jgi:hypothetical protein